MEVTARWGALFACVLMIFLSAIHISARIPEGGDERKNPWVELLTSFKNPLLSIVAVAGTLMAILTIVVFVVQVAPTLTTFYFIFAFWVSVFIFFLSLQSAGSKIISRRIIASMAAATVIASWLLYPSWLTRNLVAILSGIAILVALRMMSLRTLAVTCIGIIIYDLVAVFGTKQMIELAVSVRDVPLLISIPNTLDLVSGSYVRLGLGDIVIPGALIMTTVVAKNRAMQISGMIGYFLGLAVAMMVHSVTHAAQPATIYLIPATLMGIALAARSERRSE